jgi:hypothetical protein
MKLVDSIQQSMLIAPLPGVKLLSVRPAFEQLAAGLENLAARATALQDAQRVRRSHKVHAQLVRWASERQPRQPDEARETARHVEIGAFRHIAAVTIVLPMHPAQNQRPPKIERVRPSGPLLVYHR